MSLLKIFSREDIEKIHEATMKILEKIGVRFRSDKAIKYLKDVGVIFDEKKRAYIPRSLIEEFIKKVPKSFTWRARNKRNNLEIGSGKVHLLPSYGAIYIIDLDGNRRLGTLKDVEELTKIADALPNIHAAGGRIVQPSDIEPRASHAYLYKTMIENSSKCVMGYTRCIKDNDVALDCMKMASIIWGGEEELKKVPTVMGLINPRSPLEHDSSMIESIIEYAKWKQPLIIASFVIIGATGPVTLAGSLAQHNAEVLSGILLAQVVNPGTPIVYGSATAPVDMKSGNPAIGSPEALLVNTMAVELANFYNIPSRTSFLVSDSKIPDVQAGYEVALGALLAGMVKPDINLHAGIINSYLMTSPAQMVINDEIWSYVSRFLKGIEINDDTLALDVIGKVVEKGHFLAEEHTRRFFFKEYYSPDIADRSSWDDWVKRGSKDGLKRAIEKAKKILETHKPEPLEPDVKKELEEVVKEVAKRWSI
ncbi:hypothetical protein HRbin06_00484 [archaeon HR06]|nr:hypothetical protein HRbin06_00484 [archaeon HR06]